MKNKKVLVVGAGPAGCSTAYFIKHFNKESTIDVDLIDRLNEKKYIIYHDMCGEGVSSDILNDLNPIRLEGILSKIELIREFYPGGIEIRTKMKGLLIDRSKCFESIKNEYIKIGGNYQENAVKDFFQSKEKVKIKFREKYIDYDFVVAADGANSLFRKRMNIGGLSRALVQYIIDREPEENTIKFYYDEKFKGDYLWEFPHEGKTKIGFPVGIGTTEKPKEKILSKQARQVAYGGLDNYIHGKILFVGDAACQANPMTKGGIRAAIIAGKFAANAIVAGDLQQYEREWIKTKFSSKIFLEAFKQLEVMNNSELAKHIKPFSEGNAEDIISKSFSYLRLLLFYNKYFKLYRAYELSNECGW
jgi:flavin-dependent dehydrogenase